MFLFVTNTSLCTSWIAKVRCYFMKLWTWGWVFLRYHYILGLVSVDPLGWSWSVRWEQIYVVTSLLEPNKGKFSLSLLVKELAFITALNRNVRYYCLATWKSSAVLCDWTYPFGDLQTRRFIKILFFVSEKLLYFSQFARQRTSLSSVHILLLIWDRNGAINQTVSALWQTVVLKPFYARSLRREKGLLTARLIFHGGAFHFVEIFDKWTAINFCSRQNSLSQINSVKTRRKEGAWRKYMGFVIMFALWRQRVCRDLFSCTTRWSRTDAE